jgi:hypothetical protein
MAAYKDKDLSRNVEALIKPRAAQVMLSNIIKKTEFNAFFEGRNKVNVFFPDKISILANIKVTEDKNSQVWLEFETAPPNTEAGTVLLIIFPLGTANYIAQCEIMRASDNRVFIKALDPRINERIKTLIDAKIYTVSKEILNRIEDGHNKIKRTVEFKESKTMRDPYSCKDWFTTSVNNIQDPISNDGFGPKIKAIVADISRDGCCICISNEFDCTQIFESNIIYLDLTFPSIKHKKSAQLFVLVRANRKLDSMMVFHCMFLEPIPAEYLII